MSRPNRLDRLWHRFCCVVSAAAFSSFTVSYRRRVVGEECRQCSSRICLVKFPETLSCDCGRPLSNSIRRRHGGKLSVQVTDGVAVTRPSRAALLDSGSELPDLNSSRLGSVSGEDCLRILASETREGARCRLFFLVYFAFAVWLLGESGRHNQFLRCLRRLLLACLLHTASCTWRCRRRVCACVRTNSNGSRRLFKESFSFPQPLRAK